MAGGGVVGGTLLIGGTLLAGGATLLLGGVTLLEDGVLLVGLSVPAGAAWQAVSKSSNKTVANKADKIRDFFTEPQPFSEM